MNTTPQILLPDGEEVQLSLADPQQQLQAVKDLLQRQLIHAALDEQHTSLGLPWFTRAVSVSANQVLTAGSHRHNPLHTLAVVALLLGCDMRVRLPLPAVEEDPTSQPTAKRRRGANVGSSPAPRGRNNRYLFVSRPDKRGSSQEVGLSAAAAGGDAAGSASGAIPEQKKGMLLQLSLRQEGGLWLFDVVSSTMMVSSVKGAKQRTTGRTAELGKDDDQYELCTICGQREDLTCCDGRCCAVVLHAHHLPPAEQEAVKRQPKWLCSTCTLRGRSVDNPQHLREA